MQTVSEHKVALKQVAFNRGDHPVFQDLSLTIPTGGGHCFAGA